MRLIRGPTTSCSPPVSCPQGSARCFSSILSCRRRRWTSTITPRARWSLAATATRTATSACHHPRPTATAQIATRGACTAAASTPAASAASALLSAPHARAASGACLSRAFHHRANHASVAASAPQAGAQGGVCAAGPSAAQAICDRPAGPGGGAPGTDRGAGGVLRERSRQRRRRLPRTQGRALAGAARPAQVVARRGPGSIC